MNYVFSILCIIGSILISILDIKKRELKGFEKIKVITIYSYFGISMAIMGILLTYNVLLSALIFLHLIIIFAILNIIYKSNILVSICLLVAGITGFIMTYCYYRNINFHIILAIICGVSIYVLPGCAYIERRNAFIKKVKLCKTELDAKVIKVYKSKINYRKIYIPQFEFYVDNKKYSYMDSNTIYSYSVLEEGESVKLFVNTNNLTKSNIIDNVFLPNSYYHNEYNRNTLLFYIVTTLLFLIVVYLRNFT